MLEMLEKSGNWASRVLPFFNTDPPQPDPPLPSQDEQVRARALVAAYGSAEVKALLDEYVLHIMAMTRTVDTIRSGRQFMGGEPGPDGRLGARGDYTTRSALILLTG